MAITGQGHLTYLVSQNKQIRIWHHRLAHISNVQVVKALKLVDSIDLALANKKYDPVEVYIDFKDFDLSDNKTANSQSLVDIDPPPMIVSSTHQDGDEIDKLCAPYVGSKSTQIVKQNKTMILTTKKL